MSTYRNNTENFYRDIIQKVCNHVKEDFHNEGIGEDVIQDLSRSWSDKLTQIGIFQRIPFVIRPGMDPNYSNTNLMKYGGTNEINRGHFYPTGINGIPSVPSNHFKSDPNKTTADNISVYLEKKNYTNIYQFEPKPKFTTIGTGPQIKPLSEGQININYIPDVIKEVNPDLVKDEEASDEDSDLDVFEVQKIVPVKKEEENLEDESLSSISKDSEYIESEATDFLLAQYDKVHRVRNKWKCTFKDAVLHINGKEYVFERVVGELERDW